MKKCGLSEGFICFPEVSHMASHFGISIIEQKNYHLERWYDLGIFLCDGFYKWKCEKMWLTLKIFFCARKEDYFD